MEPDSRIDNESGHSASRSCYAPARVPLAPNHAPNTPCFIPFVSTTPRGVAMMTDISSYLDFVLTMFFAFGVAFEVPIAVVLLVITGIVSVEKLKAARGYVLIGIFVIAAFLTPPDAVSQCIMAGPMYLLFEGGIIMARVLSRMRREAQEREEAGASQG